MKLTDLFSRVETIEVAAGALEVGPLGAGDLAGLFLRYPAFQAFLSGDVSVDTMKGLAICAPIAIPEMISIACGVPGPAGLAAARMLTAEDQIRVIDKVLALTFPGGADSFFDQLAQLFPPQKPTEPADSQSGATENPDIAPDPQALMSGWLDS